MAARRFLFLSGTPKHWQWGVIEGSDLPDVQALFTNEMDSTKVLKPTGDGGLTFGAPFFPATDPGDIADPTIATAEDVALKLNTLMANLRTAGLIA